MVTTLEKEKVEPGLNEVQEVDKQALCRKLCTTIVESLLEGYNELKVNHPEKEKEFQLKIEELQNSKKIFNT